MHVNLNQFMHEFCIQLLIFSITHCQAPNQVLLNLKHPISTDLDIAFLTVLGQEWVTVLTGLYSPFEIVFYLEGELRPVTNYFLQYSASQASDSDTWQIHTYMYMYYILYTKT